MGYPLCGLSMGLLQVHLQPCSAPTEFTQHLHVPIFCLSLCIKQTESHYTHFCEISYWRILQKTAKPFLLLFRSENFNDYFIRAGARGSVVG
jgi:hypothetical protein